MYYECGTCASTFNTLNAYEQHAYSTKHCQFDEPGEWKCEACDFVFSSEHASYQHMDALGHWSHGFDCETCIRAYRSQADCDRHMSEWDHYRPSYEREAYIACSPSAVATADHTNHANHLKAHYCDPCQRSFQNENNLRMHLKSKTHLGSSIACPFCKRTFTLCTGLAHHLETGSCPQARNVNREVVYRYLRSQDPHGRFTNKQPEWNGEETGQYQATDQSWNGHAYQCYLCHRTFRKLLSLNQHIASPIHKQDIYHCSRKSCGLQFKTLGSLFNHLESEKCGVQRFKEVQRELNGFFTTTSQRLIGFTGSSVFQVN